MALCSISLGPSDFKEREYNPTCDANEESVSDMLNEKLSIYSDDELDWEIEAETVSEESSNEMSESESETGLVCGKA
jgi:hypothetical protein